MTATTMNSVHPPPIVTELAHLAEGALTELARRYPMDPSLREAVEYSLLGGGKRLRPVLAILCCEAVGGRREDALPAAMAVELIHAFSLVHDDLPAMDDDDLRRGRATLHIAKSEALAILAGDMMFGLAFSALVESDLDPALAGRLAGELAVGTNAMISGQVEDTLGGGGSSGGGLEHLERIHRHKTGALIRSACRMGALIGLAGVSPTSKIDHPQGAYTTERAHGSESHATGTAHGSESYAAESESTLSRITMYADAVGLMFQIVDDLLDVEQSTEHIGKGARKDSDAGKLTYPGILGVDSSRREIARLHQVALGAIASLGPEADHLRDLCGFLAIRTK